MKLAEWRKSRGLTQEALADELGVNKSTIMRWESGDRDPSRGEKRRLFVLSGGAIEPNDFYDLPVWRRMLSSAVELLCGKAA